MNEFIIRLAAFITHYAAILSGFLILEAFIRLVMLWDNLRNERGTDRICWFLVLGLPIFGPLAYIFIALAERDERLNSYGLPQGNGLREPSPESLAAAQVKLDKELNRPAKTEAEWLARFMKR